MNGKTSKLASTILSALLYTQGLLGIGPAAAVVVMKTASLDAQLR